MSRTDVSALSLFRATPEQQLTARKRASQEWPGILTGEQYVERDEVMNRMEHAADSRLVTWVLAPRDDPTTLDFMCSCDTYRRDGLVLYARSDGKPGEPRDATCYGIASLYTPHDKRKNGYASHTMRLLHWVLSGRSAEHNLPQFPSEWGTPPAEVEHAGRGLFSVLYSDVGEDFYKKSGPALPESGGWEATNHISTVWEVQPERGELQSSEGWTWLKYGDLDRMWARDAELIRRTVASMPMAGSKALVSFLPDKGVGSFHVFRSMYAAEKVVPMDTWGVERSDQPTYATWSVDTRPWPPTLMVTRLTATEETFPSLLGKVLEAAKRGGIGKVEVWNLPDNLMKLADRLGGRSFERSDHINLPAIKWYGKGDTADIKWVFNEKFCWC